LVLIDLGDFYFSSRRKMTCQDFVNVKLIGRGAFGEVELTFLLFVSSFMKRPLNL